MSLSPRTARSLGQNTVKIYHYILNLCREAAASEEDGTRLMNIILAHAVTTAAAGAAAAGSLGGVGYAVATGVGVTAMMTLYGNMARVLKIEIKKSAFTVLATGVIAMIGASLSVSVVTAFAFSFIPVLGNLTGATSIALTCFIEQYVGAIIFLKTILFLRDNYLDPSKLSDEEMQTAMNNVLSHIDIKELIAEAKEAFKDHIKDILPGKNKNQSR